MTLTRLALLCIALTTPTLTNAAPPASERPADLPNPLQWLPDDSVLVLSLQVAKYWNGPESKSLRELADLHPVIPLWWTRELEKATGLRPEQIERVALSLSKDYGPLTFGSTGEPHDLATIRRVLLPDEETKTVAEREYFVDRSRGLAIAELDDRTLLFGQAALIDSYLLQRFSAQQHRTSRSVKSIASANALVSFATNTGLPNSIEAQVPPQLRPLFAATNWWASIEPFDDELRISIQAKFEDQGAAQTAVDALKFALTHFDRYLVMSQNGFQGFFAAQAKDFPKSPVAWEKMSRALEITRNAVKQAAVDATDNRCRVTMRLKTSEPVTTAMLLLTLLPRAEKQAE